MKIENERLNYLSTLCTGTHIVPAHSRNLLQKMLPRADQLITDGLEVRVTPVVVAVRVIAVVRIVAVVTCGGCGSYSKYYGYYSHCRVFEDLKVPGIRKLRISQDIS